MKFICLVILFLVAQIGFAQNKGEFPFIEHLISKEYYNEAIHLMNRDSLNYRLDQQDSLNYYKGWALYSLKNLDQSSLSLMKVGIASSFYQKSRFFAGYNQIFLENYKEAREILNQVNVRHGNNKTASRCIKSNQ